MDWKKPLVCSALAALCSVPAWAGSKILDPELVGHLGVSGSLWDADEADRSYGAGIEIGYLFGSFVELEFHGTYFPDFETEAFLTTFRIEATPVDGGLSYNILPRGRVNPYVGAGLTYCFLDSDVGEIDGNSGWYGGVGLDTGSDHFRFFAEVKWRQLEAVVRLGDSETKANLDGVALTLGGMVRWNQ